MANKKIIIFEGVDCTGKTTLKTNFEELTKYKHVCIDRAFLSQAVYAYLRGEEKEANEWLEIFVSSASKSSFEYVIVLCTAPTDMIKHVMFDSQHDAFDVENHCVVTLRWFSYLKALASGVQNITFSVSELQYGNWSKARAVNLQKELGL